MDSNKKFIYTFLKQNSKSYWKFLIGYLILLLLLFKIADFCYDFPITETILLVVYIVSLWIVTIWITVYLLKKLFTENKFLNWKIFGDSRDIKEMLTERSYIPQLSENIEEQFINYWYNEISRNKKFSDESRILVENTLKMFSEVLCAIDKTQLTYAVGNILLRHLKEFRRTLKFKEKNLIKILDLYRYSFSTMPKESRDYYIHQMTKNLLVNFIHWELWNSIPCQLVISILSTKLSFLIDLCANPNFVNYHLLKSILSEKQKDTLNLDQYAYIKLEFGGPTEDCEKNISQLVIEEERESRDEIVLEPVEQKKMVVEAQEEAISDYVQTNEPHSPERPKEAVEFFAAPENLVKVYEPKSATKTWNDTFNLDSISFGEDPLGNSIQDDDGIEADYFLKDISPGKGDATANTLRDIKDFQENTVNTVVKPMSQATSQALHKIGDLQDEAAGVVEGLFDFGLAGIRKGLKLTGLQENSSHEGTITEIKVKPLLASPGVKHTAAHKKIKRHSKSEMVEECVWVNPLQCYPNFNDDAIENHVKSDQIPSILMDSSEYESPDPEYEEAADLATTIAKLRSLLQQKSSESTSTTPIASPMIFEDNKSVLDLDEVDSFVPSFYKLCAKTATGVFNNTLNTIKTALPVNANDTIMYDVEKWDYEDSDDKEADLVIRMNRLLHERKDFCMIETAYDAFDSQQHSEDKKNVTDINFQDELDEFESWVPLAKIIVDVMCELISESDTFISQEPFVRFILLVLGQSIDETISSKVEDFLRNICITEIPIKQNQESLKMELDVFVDYLMSGMPDALIFFIGHSTLKDALTMFVSSIQFKKCNLDVIMQVLEYVSVRLMEESSKNSSLYSAQ